ncbi:MAG: diphthamide synthesis protein [Nanoarchaeota archaeon]|nr:diphthamide synthesis protein [Nanoarchaeota archaeon]
MENKTIEEIEMDYSLELNKVIANINNKKAKLVLLQFPDGLKSYATTIVDYLREKTGNKTEFLIWLGSCYGACDVPVGLEKLKPKINLVVQFGHNSYGVGG